MKYKITDNEEKLRKKKKLEIPGSKYLTHTVSLTSKKTPELKRTALWEICANYKQMELKEHIRSKLVTANSL